MDMRALPLLTLAQQVLTVYGTDGQLLDFAQLQAEARQQAAQRAERRARREPEQQPLLDGNWANRHSDHVSAPSNVFRMYVGMKFVTTRVNTEAALGSMN